MLDWNTPRIRKRFSHVEHIYAAKVPLLNSKRILLATAVLMLFLSLSVSIQPATAGSATVSTQVTCKGIDKSQAGNWQPIDVTDTFSTADETVFSFINLENVNPPVDITFVWVAPHAIEMEGKTYTTLANDPTKIGFQGSGSAYGSLTIARPNVALPVGIWTVEVYGDTTLLSTVQFKLQPSVDFVSKSFSPKEGEPVYAGDTVTATYQLQNTGKTILKAVSFAVATPLPQGVSVVEATPPKDIAPGATEEFVLKTKFEIEGTYTPTIQLYINEELILEGSLQVQVSPAPFPWTLVILGIIAVVVIALVVVLVRRRRAPSPPTAAAAPYVSAQPAPVAPQATKYCTSCGSPIPQDAKHCTKCGASQG
jgi:hypothetical protein